jgi:hypothetical protein
MNFLTEHCTILTRSLTEGMVDTESWQESATVRCRKLTKESGTYNPKTLQHGTRISTRFMLPLSTTLSIGDRIRQNRTYTVVEVVTAKRMSSPHHLIAICESIV